jgi:hypothetical protein
MDSTVVNPLMTTADRLRPQPNPAIRPLYIDPRRRAPNEILLVQRRRDSRGNLIDVSQLQMRRTNS